MNTDLFGHPLPEPPTRPRPQRWASSEIEEVQAVLRIALQEGYVLVGAADQVYGVLTGTEITRTPRHEADLVTHLLDAGWLNRGATRSYQDGTEDLTGRVVLVPTSSRTALTRWATLRPLRRCGGGHR